MKPSQAALITLALLAFSTSNTLSAKDFALSNNDRVLFYGDSITQQRLYTDFVESFVATRFPDLNIVFVNSGWNGDRVSGGGGGPIDTRLQRDLFPYRPTVLTVMLGMNDGRYTSFNDNHFSNYTNGYEHIAAQIRKNLPNTRVTLIATSPFDDVTRPPKFADGYNSVLAQYGKFVRKLAKKNDFAFVDFNAPVVEALQKARAKDPATAELIIKDRVHPGPGGHLVMALTLLQAWNAPALVSSVEITATPGNPTARATNTALDNLAANPDGSLQWTQLDQVLPLGINLSDPATALANQVSGATDALNRQTLKITGLPKDDYILEIDGVEIGAFTAAQLANGINLGALQTPMMEQALLVHKLTTEKNNLHFNWWRTIYVPVSTSAPADAQAAMTAALPNLETAEQALVNVRQAAAKPLPRKYLLKPALPPPPGVWSKTFSGNTKPTLPIGISKTNLARGKPYHCTDPNRSNWTDGLTDGSYNMARGNTFATGVTADFPKHVTVDLGKNRPLSAVSVGVPDFGSTKTVVVSLSVDGQDFAPVGQYDFPLAKAETRLFGFPARNARYIRLTYVENHSASARFPVNYSFATELEAFGPK